MTNLPLCRVKQESDPKFSGQKETGTKGRQMASFNLLLTAYCASAGTSEVVLSQ
jgi:hypothetical protein